MPFNFLLVPLLGGFVVISLCNRFRFKSVRLDGYRLLLHSSLAGLFLLGFAELLVVIIRPFLPSFDVAFHQAIPFQGSGVATLAFLLSFPLCLVANLIYKVENEIDRVIDAKGDPLELILRKSLKETKSVLISVKSGKGLRRIGDVQFESGCGGRIYENLPSEKWVSRPKEEDA